MPPSIDQMLNSFESAMHPMPRATNWRDFRLPGDIVQPSRIAGRASRRSR